MTADPFFVHRNLLFTVAYELLGSAVEAEDVVQDSWLRWADADRSQVRDPRAYLVQIVTRQSLNRLRSLSRRRESYVGEWLPEPLLTGPDVAENVELAENISTAMLIVLETLGPTERAVFVLNEVFDVSHHEIAEILGKTSAAVRQIARRARDHVAARHPRKRVSRSEQEAVVERFVSALQTGQLRPLLDVLAPEVVLIADGGGLAAAATAPIHGSELVATMLLRQNRVLSAAVSWINGAPGCRVEVGDHLALASFEVEGDRIARIYVVANPQKLTRQHQPTELANRIKNSPS